MSIKANMLLWSRQYSVNSLKFAFTKDLTLRFRYPAGSDLTLDAMSVSDGGVAVLVRKVRCARMFAYGIWPFVGPRTPLSCLSGTWSDCLGDSWKVLSYLWHPCSSNHVTSILFPGANMGEKIFGRGFAKPPSMGKCRSLHLRPS